MKYYEIFEFKNGKSMRMIEGPLMFLAVPEGADKVNVLAEEKLPGATYGYGFREIQPENFDQEREIIANQLKRYVKLMNELDEFYCVDRTLNKTI